MKVHMIMQGKGGVGKTLVSSLLSQYFQHLGRKILCFDTDPINATFSGYKALNVVPINLMQNNTINIRNFDAMIESIMNNEADDIIIDNGASSFVPLAKYLLDNAIPDFFAESNIDLFIHTIITGSQGLVDCITAMDALINNFAKFQNIKFIIWLNNYFGPIEFEGKNFYEMNAYINHQNEITSCIEIPEYDRDTYGVDYTEVLQAKKTFAEGYNDKTLTIMNRQRLKNLEKRLFKIVEEYLYD